MTFDGVALSLAALYCLRPHSESSVREIIPEGALTFAGAFSGELSMAPVAGADVMLLQLYVLT